MTRKSFFYLILLFCFILDFVFFAFFEQQLLFFTLSFFLLYVCRTTVIRMPFIALSLLFLALESFFYCGRFGLQLMYIFPTAIIGIQTRRWLYAPSLPYLLLIACLMANQVIMSTSSSLSELLSPYTFIKIIANIIVMIGISLKFYSRGGLGNRLNTVFWFQEESPDSQ